MMYDETAPHISLNQRRNIVMRHFRRTWLIIIFGIVLFGAGLFILLNNERDTARQIVSLDEALASVRTISMGADRSKPRDDELLHIVDRVYTDEPLTEPDYNIQVQAVKLKRRVQLFQWIEETTEHSNMYDADRLVDSFEDRTYYYVRDWRNKIVHSSLFHWKSGHENPKEFPILSRVQIANRITLGGLELSEIAKLKFNDYIDITSDTRPDDPSIKLHAGMYYHCNNVFEPEVGDIRLQFYAAGIEGNFYTIIAKLKNGKLVPYETSINTSVLVLLPGRHTVEEAFHAAHHERKLHAWIFRFIGWVLLFFSATCLSPTLSICFGDIRLFAMLLPKPQQQLYGNVVLSLSCAITVMALCWLLFRLWLAIGMICVAMSPFLFWAHGTSDTYQRFPIG